MSLPPRTTEQNHNLVQINCDSAEVICTLHGIGSNLAKRIVEYRDANGYFSNPDDLAKVKGLSNSLVESIAPKIEWSLPSPTPFTLESYSINDTLLKISFLFLDIFVFVGLFNGVVNLDIVASEQYLEYSYTNLVISLSFMPLIIAQTIALFLFSHVHTRRTFNWLASACRVMVLLTVSIYIFLGIPAAYSDIFSGLWAQYVSHSAQFIPNYVPFIFLVSSYVLFWGPIGLQAIGFSRSNKTIYQLSNATNIGILSWALFRAWHVWVTVDSAWLSESALNVAEGISLIVWSALGLITKRAILFPLFQFIAATIDYCALSTGNAPQFQAIKWLNTHLPNPNDQKKLRDELNNLYPTSRSNQGVLWLILAIGIWIVNSSFGAVLQLIVQELIKPYLYFLK